MAEILLADTSAGRSTRDVGNSGDSRALLVADAFDKPSPLKHSGAGSNRVDFNYDVDGKLMSIMRADGSNITKGNDGNWFEKRAGEEGSRYINARIYNDRTGNVVIKYADKMVT